MGKTKLILDHVYEHEAQRGNAVYLTQPTGNGQTVDYTWADVVGQARRMAAHLKAQNFEPGARIAILAQQRTARLRMAWNSLGVWDVRQHLLTEADDIQGAIRLYMQQVADGSFPGPEHSF